MGLFDDIDNEVLGTSNNNVNININNNNSLFSDLDLEVEAEELERQRLANRGFIPMAKRTGNILKQVPGNLWEAGKQFVKDTYEGGKQELELAKQGGYNPIEAVGAVGYGALQGGANLVEGAWNLPGDIRNLYEGQELTKPTHPLTQGLPNLINKTQLGQNLSDYQAYLQGKYPLATTLSQELGEEIPGMIAGAGIASKLGKIGKTGKKATSLKDIGYKELAGGSAVGGLGEGLLIDPSSDGTYQTPEERWLNRFTNAGTGAVIAPALNIGTKATLDTIDAVSPYVQQGVDYAKEVTGEIIKNGGNGAKFVADEIVNRLNPNNYEQTIEMIPQEMGVGLSQRTEYVPQVKRVYKNPNLQPNTELNVTGEIITPQTQVNQPLLTNTPLLPGNGTGFVLGETGDLIQQLAPNVYKKQLAKVNSKPIMALSDKLSTNTTQVEKVARTAPKTIENKEKTVEEQISSLETKIKRVGKDTVLGKKYQKQIEELRNNFIQVGEFKYNPKEDTIKNAEKYINAQEDYVNAYNEYVKNPTSENKEKYQNIYGKKLKEYNELEPMLKDVGSYIPSYNTKNVKKSTENGNNNIKGKINNETRQEPTRSELGDNSINNERREGTRQESNERVLTEQSRNGSNVSRIRYENNDLILEHKELIEKNYKNAHELNTSIENFINNKEFDNYDVLPEQVKDWLKKYTGAGGLEKQGATGKGLLSEYYTPKNIVKKMWDLTAQYINTDGAKVLEPSVGIGRFLELAPENINADVVEMNPTSAKITELLYPNANVEVGEFQQRFIKNNAPVKSITPEYDIVIGNPPYGQYSGKYKGMGEGKGIERIEAYFIKRSLDSLKDNGILTFIVPSSFLDGKVSLVKQQIGQMAELLDAYRLPENTFDTTSIGTDIIVMRKTKQQQGQAGILNNGRWFEKHPEKILGETLERKGRYGKEETYVKGNKNAVENIDTSKKDIKETKKIVENKEKVSVVKETTKTTKKTAKTETAKGKVEYNEYKPLLTVSDEEMKYFADTQVDGTLPKNKYSPNEKVNQYNGKLYNDFNYLQGDIYEKLEALEYENISEKQKEIQRKKLNSVLPKPKTVKEINFNPTSDFVKDFIVGEDKDWDWYSREYITRPRTIVSDFQRYIRNLGREERENVSIKEIVSYTNGEAVRFDYNYPPGMFDKKEREKFAKQQRPKLFAKLKKVSEKLFNNYISEKLDVEYQKQLSELWNREYNNLYTPDYYKMPLLVKGLRDTFYGKKLELNKLQEKGINYLTNKGIGLLGFEVGTGKTLAGIISTVQNMQMGRCKRPLILVPKQVKDNWIKELGETFPNIKVNDIGNLSKFNGNIEDNTVSVGTYEALSNIWYEPEIVVQMKDDMFRVSKRQFKEGDKRTARKEETDKEKAEEIIGKAQKNNKELFRLSELGFDHITVDEAHNFKNLFNKAEAGSKEETGNKGNSYSGIQVQGGDSQRSARLFLFVQQILKNNNNRNVFMLTATPFSNNPLEVFNMLSYLSKDSLDKVGLYNAYQFMETYAETDADWAVNINNDVVMKQLVKGFKNADSLRSIIKNVILMGTADEVGIKRPEKYTTSIQLEPSKKQLELIREAEEELMENKTENGAIFKALHKSRMATLSPDIAKGNVNVTPEEFINNSPKLHYIMQAVEAMKNKDPNTSQLIYMPMGVNYLPKIKKYLVDKGVFKADEIEVITSEVKEDKIPDITDSFNDREKGKVKLIIGTQKIKEGMNLNKNSSVLYIPQLDWNPTDFVQVVGRIWRQGNRYNKVRVVVPLLKNSSDPFMYQKLSEKTSRLNDLMADEAGDYIDSGELNTEEERLNMITLPDKKAKMYTVVENEKINGEISELKGKLDTAKRLQDELKESKNRLELENSTVTRLKEALTTIDKETEEYRYNSVKSSLDESKKAVTKYKGQVDRLEKTIKDREFDFEGKDSIENIEAEINKLEERKQKLNEIELQKLEEYTKEYNKNQTKAKSIEEHIKDFDTQTDELYGGESFYFEENPLKKSFIDLMIKLGFKANKKISLNEFIKNKDVKDILKDIDFSQIPHDTTITFIDENKYNKIGGFIDESNSIILNFAKIGYDVPLFFKALGHELKHAQQKVEYKKAKTKPIQKRSYKDIQIIKNYELGKKFNQDLSNLYSENKNLSELIVLIDKKHKQTGLNKLEIARSIGNKEYSLYKKYDKIFLDYWSCQYEKDARLQGEQTKRKAEYFEERQKLRQTSYTRQDFIRRIASGRSIFQSTKYDIGRTGSGFIEKGDIDRGSTKENAKDKLISHIPDDIDEILPKVKKPSDKVIQKIITPISTRLESISPRIKHAVRKFELDSALTENKYAETVKPFIDNLSKMPESDYAKYDLALKNGNIETINKINAKYNLQNEYKAVRNLLDEIREEANKYGLDVGYIENYFPRKVINPSKLLEEYSKSSYIRNLLKEIDPNNTLSVEEKIEKVNIALQGHNGAINANSSFTKNRKISEITKELNIYYKDSKNALVDYISNMNKAIQTRKFFGKGDNLEESIGTYTKDLIDIGLISPSQEVELKQLLQARFNQRGIHGLVQDIKNIGYIFTMGNPFSAITQIGDFAFTLYKNGVFNTMLGIQKALSSNKISREDLGINKIAQEFESDSKTSKLVDKVFKIVGLNNIDSLGKESFINASFNRLQNEAKQAINNPNSKEATKFYNYLNEIFGKETFEVMQDLNNGEVTDNVKYLLFSEISDFQPISLAEMPEAYLRSGNGRIFYMLKTYSIKLLDVYRNEVFKQFKKNPKEGLENLIKLTFLVSMLGVGADTLKDFLMGREIDLGETFIDNILKIAMFSKYQLDKSKREGIGRVIMSSIIPPSNVIDDLQKDITDEKFRTGEKGLNELRSTKNIPVLGKFYYWWFGGGIKTKEKEFKTKVKNDLKEVYAGKSDKENIKKLEQKMLNKGYKKKEVEKFKKDTLSSFSKPYKDRYVRALKKKDKQEVLKIRQDLNKTSLSPDEKQKIYSKALKEYLKK